MQLDESPIILEGVIGKTPESVAKIREKDKITNRADDKCFARHHKRSVRVVEGGRLESVSVPYGNVGRILLPPHNPTKVPLLAGSFVFSALKDNAATARNWERPPPFWKTTGFRYCRSSAIAFGAIGVVLVQRSSNRI